VRQVLSSTFSAAVWAGIALASAAPARPLLYPALNFDATLGRIHDLTFSRDGRVLAAAGATGYGVWDAQTGDLVRRGPAANLRRVAIAREGLYLLLGDSDGKASVVDLRSGQARVVATHRKPVTAIAVSVDGQVGASGDANGEIAIWNPETGSTGTLREGGHKEEIILLAFDGAGRLLSVSKDLLVITWDVQGKRPLRRATLQADVAGRVINPNSAAMDADGNRLLVGAQLVTEPRGGMLTDRRGPARPGDLQRENMLLTYDMASGLAPDPVRTGAFRPDQVALGPGGCFAFFTSSDRELSRMHIWSLMDQGDDLVREEFQAPATAIAIEPAVRRVAVGFASGAVRTWRVSGATPEDCSAYRQKTTKTTTDAGPVVVAGANAEPLITASAAIRLAVMNFEASGLDPTLGDGVAEMVAGALANNPNVTVIERDAIKTILKELELQSSGLTTADAVRVGRGLNARKVLLGSVRRFGEGTYVLLARLVDVETQQVEGSREVTCQRCKEQDLPSAVEGLRKLLIR